VFVLQYPGTTTCSLYECRSNFGNFEKYDLCSGRIVGVCGDLASSLPTLAERGDTAGGDGSSLKL